jgi:predicted transcriptional regulator
LTESLAGVRVGDIMTRELLSVSPDASVQQLVLDYFLVHPHGGYPVISNGKLLGVVTMSSVRSIPREKRDFERVSQAMVPFERTITVSPTTSAIDALQIMAKNGVGRLVVMDGDKIAGMVTRGDLMKTMRTRQELGW